MFLKVDSMTQKRDLLKWQIISCDRYNNLATVNKSTYVLLLIQ